jgi:hypothetical protein
MTIRDACDTDHTRVVLAGDHRCEEAGKNLVPRENGPPFQVDVPPRRPYVQCCSRGFGLASGPEERAGATAGDRWSAELLGVAGTRLRPGDGRRFAPRSGMLGTSGTAQVPSGPARPPQGGMDSEGALGSRRRPARPPVSERETDRVEGTELGRKERRKPDPTASGRRESLRDGKPREGEAPAELPRGFPLGGAPLVTSDEALPIAAELGPAGSER